MRSGLFIILIFLCGLTSCSSMTDENKERFCWNASYVKNNTCGGAIEDRCEKICDACVFNEPVCKACMTCMDFK
jgi:hypothetical protein